jgi:hypothetical protein
MHIYSRGGGDFSSLHQTKQDIAPTVAPAHPPNINPVAAYLSTSSVDALLTLPVIFRKRSSRY